MLVIKWALENKRVRIGYVTPTLKLSKLFFKELSQSIKPYLKETNKTDLVMEFLTGSTVQFFSAESGDSIRGFQFEYLIIDEAAYQPKSFWDDVLEATVLIKGRKVLMCSTPNFADGFFHQHVQLGFGDNPKYWTKKITIYDNPFLDADTIGGIKAKIPEKAWRKEYLSEFLDGEGVVFSNFRNCIGTHRAYKKCFVGIDWAKQNDYTVVTVINEFNEIIDIQRWTGMDYTKQVVKVLEILNKYNPECVISEENNIGAVVNEMLKKQYKGRLLTPSLTNSTKVEMIEKLVVAFEQQLIVIPNNDNLLNELGYFSCTYNPQTQTVKYSAPNGLHDDMVISLAYAYKAATDKNKISIMR
jgi:phage FluMu gp28-like protein